MTTLQSLMVLFVTADPPAFAKPELLAEASVLAKPGVARGLLFLDARGKPAYEEGHVPGAVWVDVVTWGRDFAKKTDADLWGMRFGELGITPESKVVVYAADPKEAARVWWIVSYWGVKDARLLDGGFAAWKAENGPISTEATKLEPKAVRLAPRGERLTTKDQLLTRIKAADRPQLIDSRSTEEFCGTIETAKRNGAIPGATHLDWNDLLDPKTKKFKSAGELAALFKANGIDPAKPAVTYCQSGGRAAVMAFALELMGGKPASNYYRSWSEWGNDDDTPIVKPAKK
jgi:thiosulfate/3-mercaptopyruvate sulfurtransferase